MVACPAWAVAYLLRVERATRDLLEVDSRVLSKVDPVPEHEEFEGYLFSIPPLILAMLTRS